MLLKHFVTIADASRSFDQTVSTLRKHFTHIDWSQIEHIKLANEYYKWTTLKTNLILSEKTIQIPSSALPNTIKTTTFQWLRSEKQAIVRKYYKYDDKTEQYIISVNKNSIPDEDVQIIMRYLVLIRKAVIWVDFGYNIGTEFGGRHPAIILKNLKDSLIVIPLSSQRPSNMEFNVTVDKVYGYPLMTRWANVTRITQVSLSRVHFDTIGDVKSSVLKEISNKLKNCGII